LMWYEK